MIGSLLGFAGLIISLAVGAYAIRDSNARSRQQRRDAEETQVNERVAQAVAAALERARVDGIEAEVAEFRRRPNPSGDGGK